MIGEFKMVAGDVISIGRVGYEVHIHSNGNYKGVGEIWCELRLEGVNFGIVGGGLVTIHSS